MNSSPAPMHPASLTSPVILFLDLDNNIFQSSRKCPHGQELTPVAYKTNGEACCFMTPPQMTLFEWLNQTTLVIPNTARDTATYRRAALPFTSYAICSFGGVILQPDGKREARWHSIIKAEAEKAQSTLHWLYERLLTIADEQNFDIRSRLITDQDLMLYASIKHNQHKNEELVTLGKSIIPLLPKNWTVHFNDNNLAIFPSFLGKEKAASWLLTNILSQTEKTVVIGSGDSFTDMGFMSISHFALMPTQSQIFTTLATQSYEPSPDQISN